jgi:hypothetical protein
MIEAMNARRLRIWLLAFCIACLPSLAHAQATWEDAPADGPTKLEVDESSGLAADAESDAEAEYADRDPSALSDFNAELKPYGYWRDDPTYGTVWVPHPHVVGKDFKPYVTNGHWAQDEAGEWIWVSNYPFGWVTFHYGRWVWVRGVGWSWIPGRQYANAWVVWRVPDPGVYYVGWAPMPPDYIWVNGAAVGIGFGVYTAWVFCPSLYIYDYHLHHHLVHDHHHVHYLGAHTHHYHAHGKPRYAGPSRAQARIPARVAPKRVAANPKAVAASRPSGASARRVVRGAAGRTPSSAARLGRVKSLGSTAAPANGRRGVRAPTPVRGRSDGAMRPGPQRFASPQRSAPPPSAIPQRRYAPSRYLPPTRSAPAPRRQVPVRTQPKYTAPRSSPPSVRRAPPPAVKPYRPSAPSRSAPARSRPRRR